MPALNDLAAKSFDASTTYDDQLHFLQVYVIEPHPKSPDISPYNGQVWVAQYSTKGQPRTYDSRVANAVDAEPALLGDQLMVVDDLTPGARNNPVWCTYGPCPNCAYLINQQGIIEEAQTWFGSADMETAINDLLR